MGSGKKFVFSERDCKRLRWLAKMMGVEGEAEAIRYATALVHTLIDLQRRGGKFLVEDPDGTTKEIIFPGLESNDETENS